MRKLPCKNFLFKTCLLRTHGVSLQLYLVTKSAACWWFLLQKHFNADFAQAINIFSSEVFEQLLAWIWAYDCTDYEAYKSLHKLSSQLSNGVYYVSFRNKISLEDINWRTTGVVAQNIMEKISKLRETWRLLLLDQEGTFMVDIPATKLFFDSGCAKTFKKGPG